MVANLRVCGLAAAAVAGACFDQIGVQGWAASVANELEHLSKLHREQFAEERADVDAGEEVARTARPPSRASVVAEGGMVEREVHERGHGERAAFTDDVGDHSLRTVTNTSPSPRQSSSRA